MKVNLTFFINLLIIYDFLIPKILLLVLFIMILKYQIKSLMYNWRVEFAKNNANEFLYLYKIKNFYFIWFWLFIYFFIFIFLFLSFRIYRMGYILDLNNIKKTYIILYSLKEYLFIIIFTLIVLIFFLMILLILKKIKNFLETYLLQKHLYLINYKREKKYDRHLNICFAPPVTGYTEEDKIKARNNYLTNGFYKKIFYYFYFFSYCNLIEIIIDLDYKLYCKYFEKTRFAKSELVHFSRHLKKMLNIKYNIIIPITIFFYELIFCNLTITYLFYFLPFYFFYTLWYKLSYFWYIGRIARLDAILYELYYDFPNIMYLNLDQDEMNIIFRYILGGLNEMPNPETDESSLAYRITYYKRYLLCNNKIYRNFNINDSITCTEYEEMQQEKQQKQTIQNKNETKNK